MASKLNAVFESDNGKKYVFGVDGSTVFDMEVSSGVSVDIGTAQGFSQVGESVMDRTIGGRPINVRGVIYKSVSSLKNKMRSVFSPFSKGRLIINDQYYIYVFVQDTPSFSIDKNDGRFAMRLFAPYPFFKSVKQSVKEIGNIEPRFRFPVNYANPHMFGERVNAKYVNVFNGGDVPTPIGFTIRASGESENPTITNMETLERLRLNCSLSAGDTVSLYRDYNGVLHVELTNQGGAFDVIHWVDEDSTLFDLAVGDNLLSVTDDADAKNIATKFYCNPAVVSVYET